MSYQQDRDEAEDRFATAFERIAGALELISQKMPWPFTGAVQPFVPQSYAPVPYQNPARCTCGELLECSTFNENGAEVRKHNYCPTCDGGGADEGLGESREPLPARKPR